MDISIIIIGIIGVFYLTVFLVGVYQSVKMNNSRESNVRMNHAQPVFTDETNEMDYA